MKTVHKANKLSSTLIEPPTNQNSTPVHLHMYELIASLFQSNSRNQLAGYYVHQKSSSALDGVLRQDLILSEDVKTRI